MNSNIGVATQPTIAPITQVKPAVNKLSGRFEISIISWSKCVVGNDSNSLIFWFLLFVMEHNSSPEDNGGGIQLVATSL